MLHIILGVFFILHGLVHLLGFAVNWRLVSEEGWPYSTRVLANRIEVGDTGIRIVGLLWLLAAVGFVIAGFGLIFQASWWLDLTIVITLFSTVICVLVLPVAQYALYINLAILVLLFLDGRYNWLSLP